MITSRRGRLASEGSAKRIVLAVLVVFGISLGAWAGVLTRHYWEWLETYHLAGIAIIEVLFIVVSALGAIGLAQREWQAKTPIGVARSYLVAFGVMLAAFAVVGVLVLLGAWTWALLNAALWLSFDRYLWLTACWLVGAYLIVYWWTGLHPRRRKCLRGLVCWPKTGKSRASDQDRG